jgi:hypothetical protein
VRVFFSLLLLVSEADIARLCAVTVSIPQWTELEYKYIRKDSATGELTWESDPNNSLSVGTTAVSTDDTWR